MIHVNQFRGWFCCRNSRGRILGFALLLMGMAQAQAQAQAPLERLMGEYKFASSRLADEEMAQLGSLGRQYVQQLRSLYDQTLADNKKVDAAEIEQEFKRFAAEKDVSASVPASGNEILKTLMQTYRAQRQKIHTSVDTRVLGVADNYIIALEEQEAALAKAGDVAGTQAVTAEVLRIKQDATVLASFKRLALIRDAASEAATSDGAAAPAPPRLNVPPYMQQGLVLYLPFDEPDEQAPADAMGGALTVDTQHAQQSLEGKFHSGYAFDGTPSYLTLAHEDRFDLPGELTVSLWVKPDTWDSGGGVICKGSGAGVGTSFLADIVEGHFRFVRWKADRSGFSTVSAAVPVEKGVWQHLALVTTKNRLQVFVNGKVTHGKPDPGPWLTNKEPIVLGARHRNGKDEDYAMCMKGVVDEVLVYGRALTENEVKYLYEMGL
ncbi:MAG: hypothetical protein ACI9QL_003375 [Candidatus Omnitrophota bacterium]|jgi:hypothetical protein